MCRLSGLHAGAPVDAEFWLIDAPDSLSAQSHRNPDPGWRLLEPGETAARPAGPQHGQQHPFPPVPRHLLRTADLDPAAAASQHPA